MNELDNKWLNDIRDTMSDYSEPLPEDGWKALSASLDAKACPQITPQRDRVVMHTIQRWAVAAMFVAFFSVWCDMPSGYDKLAIEIADINNNYASNIDEIAASLSGDGGTTNKLIAFNSKDNHRQYEESETRKETTEIRETTEIAGTTDEQAYQEETAQPDMAEKEKQSNTVTAYAPLSSSSSNEKKIAQVAASNKRRDTQTRNDSRWAMGLHFGGNGMDMESAGGDKYFGNISAGDGYDMLEGADNDPERDKVISSDNHTSVSIGVSLSKSLTEKLSVVTGLIYTNLASEVEMSLSGYQDQSLNYIGVPIGLRYDIIELGNWSIYGTGGTAIERCISAKRGDEKLSISKWQFSVNGGAGCHYRIGKHWGIYAEPGIRYYFDDKSGVPSIRTEHRCSFNMMIGVRFSY